MSALAWNPAWYQPGESFWSVANKLAHAACATVGEVMEMLAGVRLQSREDWLFPTRAQASSVCRQLQLPESLAEGKLFAGLAGVPTLAERVKWQLAIRHCPACLEGFMHRTCFQDLRVQSCPVHGCRLSEVCPHCFSPIDPRCAQAWTCDGCHRPLMEPGRAWLAKYRAGPCQDPCPDLEATPWPDRGYQPIWGFSVDHRLVAHLAYEEHAALSSVLLGRHVACAAKEDHANQATGMSVFFKCPVSAAAVFVAHKFGFPPQCISGAWVQPRPDCTDGFRQLEALLSTIAPDKQPEMVRRLMRAWFTDAVRTFVAAAAEGMESAQWVMRQDPRRALVGFNFKAENTRWTAEADRLCQFRRQIHSA